MRRIVAVLVVCALAAVVTAVAAGGGSAKTDHARAAATDARLRRMVLPGVGHVFMPSDQGQTCYISSGNQGCSLTPCKGFVAGSMGSVAVTGGADWIPITSQCGPKRPTTLVSPRGMPLLKGAFQRLPRLAITPNR